MPVHKKQETKAKESVKVKGKELKAASAESSGGSKAEPVIVSDTITETIEVVEGVAPQAANPEDSVESSVPQADPLKDFKEKMVEEETTVPENSQKKNFMWPILSIFIIILILLIGIFAYKQGVFNKKEVNVVTLTPTPVVTVEPTKTVDLTKYEIEILNGSGVSGEASKQKAALEEKGFTISSIGNADNSDYTDTIIKAKADVEKDFIAKLKDTLNSSFTVGETQSLPDDSSVPVVVIIGTAK
jgi:hypothetical protein